MSARGRTNSFAPHSTACASMKWLLERVRASSPASIPQLALQVVAEEGWDQLRTAYRHQRDFSWPPRPRASARPSVVILTADISTVLGCIRTMGDSWPSVSTQTMGLNMASSGYTCSSIQNVQIYIVSFISILFLFVLLVFCLLIVFLR